MQILMWVIDGLVAGWLTGKFMSSEGRDQVMDMVMGIAGGIGGGFLLSATRFRVEGMMIYTSLAAVTGAICLTFVSRYAGGSREYGRTN
jgi:uncharacterized membrane protein YeaQ/YmgE (transglycosylase-associated protein family)